MLKLVEAESNSESEASATYNTGQASLCWVRNDLESCTRSEGQQLKAANTQIPVVTKKNMSHRLTLNVTASKHTEMYTLYLTCPSITVFWLEGFCMDTNTAASLFF